MHSTGAPFRSNCKTWYEQLAKYSNTDTCGALLENLTPDKVYFLPSGKFSNVQVQGNPLSGKVKIENYKVGTSLKVTSKAQST